MSLSSLHAVFSTPSPFDDLFADDLLDCGDMVEPLKIWTHCGRRIDLQARVQGWRPLSIWRVIDDAQATWSGNDAAAWEG